MVIIPAAIVLASLSVMAAEPWTAPEEAVQIKNPLAASKDAIAKGREVYADRCADCHGKKGRGDGSGGADLERKPSDLTNAQAQAQSDGSLFWKISQGRRPMPAYVRKLSDEQRWQVVHYLRSLSTQNKPKPEKRK
jgi:mono/diheme cytochrome c family protein